MTGETPQFRTDTILPSRFEVVLFFSLGVLYLYFLVEAFGYDPRAGLFPKIVNATALSLIALRIAQIQRGDKDSSRSSPTDTQSLEPNQAAHADIPAWRIVRMCIWPFVFFIVMYLLGIYAAIPILLFAFLLIESELDLFRCAAFSTAVFLLIYLLFEVILNMREYDGILL